MMTISNKWKLHCNHGKHRSAVLVQLSAGVIEREGHDAQHVHQGFKFEPWINVGVCGAVAVDIDGCAAANGAGLGWCW